VVVCSEPRNRQPRVRVVHGKGSFYPRLYFSCGFGVHDIDNASSTEVFVEKWHADFPVAEMAEVVMIVLGIGFLGA
uniref:Uncharacterized protein n=1 Tax=Cannabis sativa TaxID=3483 RepID=A0A803PR62_CANSA